MDWGSWIRYQVKRSNFSRGDFNKWNRDRPTWTSHGEFWEQEGKEQNGRGKSKCPGGEGVGERWTSFSLMEETQQIHLSCWNLSQVSDTHIWGPWDNRGIRGISPEVLLGHEKCVIYSWYSPELNTAKFLEWAPSMDRARSKRSAFTQA